MKTPVIATILLVLTVPAFAADDYITLPPAQQVDPFVQPAVQPMPAFVKKTVLTGPALAAEWPSSATWRDINDFEWSYGVCVYRKRDDPDNPGEEIKKACADADELGKKLTAKGYCIYDKWTVGRSSKDGKHCYEIIDTRIRHDRICDFVQDRGENLGRFFNPEGGNAIMFGKCRLIEDLPVGDHISRHHFWVAIGCGYQAYREGKRLKDDPYKHEELKKTWKEGWKYARKSCATDKPPTFNRDDIK